MSTYRNCFELVREVREGLNEYDDSLARGEGTGAYRNSMIIRLINKATRELFAFIASRRPEEFMKEASITGVNSVFALPADFGKLMLFRDDQGRKVYNMFQDERRLNENGGYSNRYYQKGRTLVIDKAGVTGPYTLIYKSMPRDIHQGKAAAGDTTTITLSTADAPKIADHYVGMKLENISKDFAAEITAYTAARVATTGQTSAANDFYALVPEIPEWAQILIGPRAVIMAKETEISKEKVSKAELESYKDLFVATFREFGTPNEDQETEEMFTSFEPHVGGTNLFGV